jgi:hypothetical protein
MSLTYGYDAKEGDDMIVTPVQAAEIVSPLLLPGATLVNTFPFRGIFDCLAKFMKLTHIFSKVYPLMGTMAQLRAIGAKWQDVES